MFLFLTNIVAALFQQCDPEKLITESKFLQLESLLELMKVVHPFYISSCCVHCGCGTMLQSLVHPMDAVLECDTALACPSSPAGSDLSDPR